MTLSIKPGVTLLGLQPQMLIVVIAAHSIYARYGAELVITSGNDGVHSETSQHYGGRALDFRVSTLQDPKAQGAKIVAELSTALGRDFFVLLEEDHIHVQYKPKRPVAY